tara:strand:- start:2861 stop:3100 length:240 start_codon:yes stop_codon:yes gene_type:complete
MFDQKEMAKNYREQYNLAYNALSPEYKGYIDKIIKNENAQRFMIGWHNDWIKEIIKKAQDIYETNQLKNEKKLKEIKPK